jgi:hypothetical protein
MNDNNIIHANINEDAIVFNQTNQPLLSNFFLSFDSQKINEERKSNLFQISLQKLEQTNQIPSFQLFVIYYLNDSINKNKSSLSYTNIESICTLFINNYIIPLNILSLHQIEEYKKDCIISLNIYINKSKQDIIDEIIHKTALSCWDNYSLSLLYLKLLNTIFLSSNIINKNDNKNDNKNNNNSFINEFIQLLIINMNPNQQLTITQTKDRFYDILFNTEFDTFTHLLSIYPHQHP